MDDSIYYRDAGSLTTARNASAKARLNIYRTFLSEMKPDATTRILDIGVSTEEGVEANMLEKQYPWPERITCAGLGDGGTLLATYPGVAYARIEAGRPLPFPDGAFDIVHSNAVLEHVGGAAERRAFLREAARVGRSLFMAVPNRWFPVEHHTAIPLLHWAPGVFRAIAERTRYRYWAEPRNLDFIGRRTLAADARAAGLDGRVFHAGIGPGLFSSNLVLTVRR